MPSRRGLLVHLGTGVTAAFAPVAAHALGVVWDGDELCHHSCRVYRTAVRDSYPDDAEAVPFDDLEPSARGIVEFVLDDGKYLTCRPDTDPALNAFVERTTMDGAQRAMVVVIGGRYHWFRYRVEDMIYGRSPD